VAWSYEVGIIIIHDQTCYKKGCNKGNQSLEPGLLNDPEKQVSKKQGFHYGKHGIKLVMIPGGNYIKKRNIDQEIKYEIGYNDP
jgi:hypothetical protein